MSKQSRDTNIIDNTITDYLKPHSAKRVSKRGKNKKIPVTPEMRFYPDPKEGLDEEQVETRIGQRQINEKGKQYSKSVARIITSNLFTFFNLLCVLCVVALVAVKAALLNFTFVITYVLNLSISIFQEIRAKKAIEKLSILNEPTASVIRKGSTKEISVNDIVLDDIVKYTIGNQLSIDGTVVEGAIEVNESMLTGEAVPVKKNVGDKVFAGSYVVSGTSLVMADKVGEDRYIQTLSAKAKKFKKPSSELMTTLKWIIRIIGVLIVPMAIFVFLTNRGVVIATHPDVTTLSSGEMTEVVTKTTSVILGMIPSGMFLLTTLALAVGVVRLANRQTSVQDMYALEMLARVDVLCLDKTGTITDGRMKVSNCVLFNSSYKYDVKDIVSSMQNALSDNNQTAIALKKYFGTDNKLIATQIIPFSSSRKYSAVSFNDKGKEIGTFAIGAPEFILSRKVMPKYLTDQIRHYSSLGQRVLLLAMSEKSITGENIPADMKPFALITLSDNIRRDAIKAISWFRKNDVKVKVISGDNPMTVAEVAKRAGIEGADQFISLEGMTEREVIDVADKYNVFGRVTPEQKAVLVKAMKRAGHTVAMTGDGVNDILAMKESDCSVTVATGSDATKSIAHIVLMDNNFNSMPAVVAEGRRVINNIEKSSSLFLMKTLFTLTFAIISIFRKSIFPFDTQMMMMLEMVVIGLGSLALSMQPNLNKVSGKFVSYLFAHAIPGALVLIMNVLAIELMTKYLPPFPDAGMRNTLMVAALSFGGLTYMHVICKPYNRFRVILMLVLTTILCVWTTRFMHFFVFKDAGGNQLSMPNIFDDFTTNWMYVAVLFAILQFDIVIGNVLTWLSTLPSKNKNK